MELWSNVEKERAAHQELIAIRITRQAGHRPTDAAHQVAIDQQAAAGLSIRTGVPYEATPLKDSSADAVAGKTGKHLCDKGEHIAQPKNNEAQVSYASFKSQQMPICHGSSMAGEDEQVYSKVPGVEKSCQETAHVPGNGSKQDLGGATHDIEALEGSAKGEPLICTAGQSQEQSVGLQMPWMLWSTAHLATVAAGRQTYR